MTEIERIFKAVDDYAEAIKNRMAQKHREGYQGWDGGCPGEDLAVELQHDSSLLRSITEDKGEKHVPLKLPVDIGAWAMMFWYRNKGG